LFIDFPRPTTTVYTNNQAITVKKKKNEIFTKINISSQRDLTPKCKKIFYEAMKLKKKNDRLQRQKNNFKSRVKLAEKFATDSNNNILMNKLNSTTFKFLKSQINSQTKKPNGRRYSLDDKILSLSIYKNSPKGYRFLSTIFALPSKKTLTNLLSRVPFQAGINVHIIKHLTIQASKLKPNDRLCSLVFDEMALEPATEYNIKEDLVYGFEHFGAGIERNPILCDHVLVFMVRGIRRKWKQPIAYYFCQSATKTPQLIKCIEEVVTAVQTTGLKIISTVCDQGTANVKAIKDLKEIANVNQRLGFKVNDQVIIPIFDPPHLLKTIRNNLLNKDVVFIKNGTEYKASWDHIKTLYTLDMKNEICGLRTLPKLTEAHINPAKIKKMNVSIAAQTLSQRVAATLRLMANYGKFK